MKKLSVLLILALCLGLLAACGGAPEPAPEPTEPAEITEPAEPAAAVPTLDDYLGKWDDVNSGRAWMTILPNPGYGDAAVTIHWGDSAWESVEWTMYAAFEEDTGRLYYANGEKTIVSWSEDGSQVTRTTLWDDANGEFTFTEDGSLLWTDDREERCGDVLFQRSVAPVPLPTEQELTDGYFLAVGSYEPGTAGCSLNEAVAACKSVQFAADHQLWAADVDELQATMQAAWESLTDDERDAFRTNFPGVMTLLDNTQADYESQAGLYDDAGVGDTMRELAQDDLAMMSWGVLCSNSLSFVSET